MSGRPLPGMQRRFQQTAEWLFMNKITLTEVTCILNSAMTRVFNWWLELVFIYTGNWVGRLLMLLLFILLAAFLLLKDCGNGGSDLQHR